MKYLKFISICLVASFAMSLSAAVTAKATISVKGDEGNKTAELGLTQDDATAANFSDSNNAPYIPGGSIASPGLYALNGTTKYMEVVIPDLNGLKFKFEANAYEEDYTMSFSDVDGAEITIANADTSFVIDATKDYKFSCDKSEVIEFTVSVAQPSTYVRDNLTVGQYGTICYPGAVSNIEGGEVYELTSATATEVRGEQVTTTEAGKSYVFKATATSLVLTYDPTTEIANPATTLGMVGNFGPAEISVPTGMFGINGTSVMEVAAGTMLKANRAYINLAELQAVPGAPGRKLFDVVGEVTALDAVKAEAGKVQKVMINGQMVIIRDGKMFNAQGAAL